MEVQPLIHAQPVPAEIVQTDMDEVLYQLIRAGGNTRLAAERLGIESETLIAQIASSDAYQELLFKQMRISSVVGIFELLNQVKLVLAASLPDLTAYEVTKTFNTLADLLIRLTESNAQANPQNPVDTALRSLPPQVRKALMEIVNEQ